MANLKYIGKNILNHDLIVRKGNVSGSVTSTGSLRVTGSLSVDKGRIYEQGSSVIDHATAMAIVFGG